MVGAMALMIIGVFLVVGVWACFNNTGREFFRTLVADFNSVETIEAQGHSRSDVRNASQSDRRAKQD